VQSDRKERKAGERVEAPMWEGLKESSPCSQKPFHLELISDSQGTRKILCRKILCILYPVSLNGNISHILKPRN
jgi:hypothetical protein